MINFSGSYNIANDDKGYTMFSCFCTPFIVGSINVFGSTKNLNKEKQCTDSIPKENDLSNCEGDLCEKMEVNRIPREPKVHLKSYFPRGIWYGIPLYFK